MNGKVASALFMIVVLVLLACFCAFIGSNEFNRKLEDYEPIDSSERCEVIEFDLIEGVVVYTDGESIDVLYSKERYGSLNVEIIEFNETHLIKNTYKTGLIRFVLYLNMSDVKEIE